MSANRFLTAVRLSIILLLLARFAASGATVIWDASPNQGDIESGTAVTEQTNPWWVSSSTSTRFQADGTKLIIPLQPGHELSNHTGIEIDDAISQARIELLLRTEEAVSLGLHTSFGQWIADPEGTAVQSLLVPGLAAPDYQWFAFDWIAPAPETAAAFSPLGANGEGLQLTIYSIDSSIFVGGARLVAIPEPTMIAGLYSGLMLAVLHRRRPAARLA